VVPAGLCLERLDALLAGSGAGGAQVGQDRVIAKPGCFGLLLLKGNDDGVESDENFARNFVAAELGEELLLGGEIKVFVVDDLVPNALSIDRQTIGGNSPVIFWQEHPANKFLVFGGSVTGRETSAELIDLLQELVGLENLVRESGKGKVKIIFDL